MKRVVLFLAILMIFTSTGLFSEKAATLENVYKPMIMGITDGKIFVLDNFSVKVFSLTDYSFSHQISKRGEGPGEINEMNDTDVTMIVNRDNVLLNSVHKIIAFDTSGKVIREKKFRELVVEAIPFKNGYIITFVKWVDATAHAFIKICDEKFDEVKEIYKTRLPLSYKIKKISIPAITTYARCTKDKIFLFDQSKDVIMTYNHNGIRQGDIAFEYDKVTSTKAFKDKILKDLVSNRNKKVPEDSFKRYLKMIYTPEILPAFKNSWIIDNEIYIHTWREKENKSEFLILDFKGKVKDKKFLPGSTKLNIRFNPAATFTFHNGVYYYLIENLDQEEWELHKMKLK